MYRQQRGTRKAIRLGFQERAADNIRERRGHNHAFWRHWQRAMALLAGVGCAVFIVAPASSAALALRPTTEMLLRTLRGVTLSSMTVDGQSFLHLTPLNE